LKWLMKYDHKKFISLYLMTWRVEGGIESVCKGSY